MRYCLLLYRVSRLPPVSFTGTGVSRVSRVCPGSPGVFLPVQYPVSFYR